MANRHRCVPVAPGFFCALAHVHDPSSVSEALGARVAVSCLSSLDRRTDGLTFKPVQSLILGHHDLLIMGTEELTGQIET